MGIGKYGLKDPYTYAVSKFDVGEEYIVNFYTPYDDYSFTVWTEVVRANNEEAVLHVTQDRPNCSSIRVTTEECEAVINGEPTHIQILGYVKPLDSDNVFIYGGEQYDENRLKLTVLSEDNIVEATTDDSKRVRIDCTYEIIEVKILEYSSRCSLQVHNGSDYLNITELKTEPDCWLQLGAGLDGMNAYFLDVDGLIKEINIH